MRTDDRFYSNNSESISAKISVTNETQSNTNNLYDASSVNEFVKKMNSIYAPYVNGTYITLGSRNNPVVFVSVSLDKRPNWKNGMLEKSHYAKFRIESNGRIEKVSGNLPNFKKTIVSTSDEAVDKINSYLVSPEKYEGGANIEIQSPYYPASDVCESLDTLVPTAMASELKTFNQGLKAFIENKYNMSVAEFVAMKLHYKSVDDLCYDPIKKDEVGNRIVRFAQEQIDAIATAIYSHEERGDGIIIADQTGVGKGRTAAGILRYAILDKKVIPFFFTEKKHLINDIYRDLVDIGFDAGIIEEKLTSKVIKKTDWSEEEVVEIIIEDIKNEEDVQVEYPFPENFKMSWLEDYNAMTEDTIKKDKSTGTQFNYEQISEIMDELIALYTELLIEKGREVSKPVPVPESEILRQQKEAEKEGRIRVRPFISNNINVVDKDGNTLYKKLPGDEFKRIIGYYKEGKEWKYDYDMDSDDLILPDKYKLIAMSFSQVQQLEEEVNGVLKISPKFRFFSKYAKGSVLVIDEAHTASGGSPENPSNIFRALSQLIGLSDMTTYLSATYAKRAINMPLYAIATSMKESGLSNIEMITTFLRGDTALQEAVSAELTRNGQLLRREKQIQGKSDYYYVYDGVDDIGTQQRLRMDKVAELFRKATSFQRAVHSIIKDYKKDLPSMYDFTPPRLEGSKEQIEKHRSNKALTFQMFNFFLLGLKIDQTTKYTLEKLKNGIKPVITVANTLESALNNMPKSFMTLKESDKYKVGDTIENDFKLYIAYLLFYTMRWKKMVEVVDDNGRKSLQPKVVSVFDDKEELSEAIKDNLMGEYRSILSDIMASKTGVSIAPIDEIKKRIKDEGFSINEITGRQLEVSFDSGDYSKGMIRKRDVKDTTELVRDFNENKVDALFINQSGAVGISMHARPVGRAKIVYPISKTEIEVNGEKKIEESGWPTSLDNENEVKKRAMIVTQMELDINKEVQKLGRINRTGQVYPPEFTYIISTIPSENRLTAMMERKLRSLSANVSSNQQQSSYLFESDDFFSIVAIVPFNETMKDLGRIERAPDGQIGVMFIKEFTKMLYFSTYESQKQFYDTFSRRLNDEIVRLTKAGLYTGKIGKKDYKAKTLAKYPFFIGNEQARTSFGRHSFIEKAAIVEYAPKNIDRDIESAINTRLSIQNLDKTETTYKTLDEYKKAAKNELQGNSKTRKEVTEIENKRLQVIVDEKTKQAIEKREELKKYGNLVEILAVEESLNKITTRLDELKVAVAEAMQEAPEKLAELGTEMTTLKSEEKVIREKLDSFGDYKQLKQESKSLDKDIKRLEDDVEDLKSSIEKNLKDYDAYNNLMNEIEIQVNGIGQVVNLTRFEEVPSYETETGDVSLDIQKYTYNEVFSKKAVIVGVKFPHYQYNITPSSIDIAYMSVTEPYYVPFSQIKPKNTEEQIAKGKMPTYRISVEYNDYKDKVKTKTEQGEVIETSVWNKIASETDTGVDKTKWFVVGSVLKSFMLSRQNGLTGEILKFTMEKNIDRIGIEITDKKKQGSVTEGTYTDLDRRYDEETALKYLVYYDGNSNNLDNLMTRYMYDYMFGRLYDLHKTKDIDSFNYGITDDTKFVFEISSSLGFSAVVVTPSQDLIDMSINLYEGIEDNSITEIIEMEMDEFVSSLEVEIVTTQMSYANAFGVMLNSLGVDIDSSNFYITSKSDVFPNISVSKLNKRELDRQMITVYGNEIFKTVFPIDLSAAQVELSIHRGFRYAHRVSMSYEQFLNVSKEFENQNQKPTYSTSNTYFSTQKHLYVLEQFVDNMVEIQEVKGGDIDFTPVTESETQKQIDVMIDNLVKILS
jgi:hypothetical protein